MTISVIAAAPERAQHDHARVARSGGFLDCHGTRPRHRAPRPAAPRTRAARGTTPWAALEAQPRRRTRPTTTATNSDGVAARTSTTTTANDSGSGARPCRSQLELLRDAALGHRVRECADEGREPHVGNGEEELEQRHHPLRCRHLDQHRDRCHQQRVLGERREELRRHDDVETERHARTGAASGMKAEGERSPATRRGW